MVEGQKEKTDKGQECKIPERNEQQSKTPTKNGLAADIEKDRGKEVSCLPWQYLGGESCGTSLTLQGDVPLEDNCSAREAQLPKDYFSSQDEEAVHRDEGERSLGVSPVTQTLTKGVDTMWPQVASSLDN